MTKLKLLSVCSLLILGACAQKGSGDVVNLPVNNGQNIEITGGIIDANLPATPIVSNDPDVKVFPLDGPVQSPLSIERHNGVLENTTAGGYTVFDDSVKVYPLPGDETPSYLPTYAVPPLKNQYKPEAPMVGQKLTSIAQSSLPPVPTVEVGEADPFANPPVSGVARQPITLTNAEPAGLQPPSAARAPMLSPFADERGDVVPAEASQGHDNAPRSPVLLTAEPITAAPAPHADAAPEAAPAPAQSGAMAAGRKSSPLLTGY